MISNNKTPVIKMIAAGTLAISLSLFASHSPTVFAASESTESSTESTISDDIDSFPSVLESDLSSYSEFNWIDSYEDPDPTKDTYTVASDDTTDYVLTAEEDDASVTSETEESDPLEEEIDVIKKYYPRIRKVNNTWLLFYQTTQTGGDVYYSSSKNLTDWAQPQLAFRHTVYKDVENPDILDGMVFSNCDAMVLSDGSIFAYASYHSSNQMTLHPELNGILCKTGTLNSDGSIEWSESENDIITTKNGEDVSMGGRIACSNTSVPWEPSAIRNGNTIILTYTESVKPSHLIDMPHAPSCTGVVVSQDNWSCQY